MTQFEGVKWETFSDLRIADGYAVHLATGVDARETFTHGASKSLGSRNIPTLHTPSVYVNAFRIHIISLVREQKFHVDIFIVHPHMRLVHSAPDPVMSQRSVVSHSNRLYR